MQISIFGIAIAFVIWLVLGIAVLSPVWKRIQNRPQRWRLFGPLVAAVVVLPYADELWIAWHFHEVCKDAGVHIVRKVEVEGFYDSTRSTGNREVYPGHADELEKSRFQFMEYRSDDEKRRIVKVEKKDGRWQKTVLDRPTARYHYKFADERHAVPAGFQLEKGETQVIDSETREFIARETWYNRYPGLVEGLWVRFFGNGMTQCPDPEKGPPREHLPNAALLAGATR
jgi:hypothetical protein